MRAAFMVLELYILYASVICLLRMLGADLKSLLDDFFRIELLLDERVPSLHQLLHESLLARFGID